MIPLTSAVASAESHQDTQQVSHYSVDDMRSDFTQLYQGLQQSHFDLFINLPKTQYDQAFQKEFEALNKPLSLAELIQRFQRFTALSGIAHARIEGTGQAYSDYRDQGGSAIPFTVRVVDGRTYVATNFSADSVLDSPTEICAINGESIASVLNKLRVSLSADTEHLANTLLEFQFPRLMWQEYGSRDHYQVTLCGTPPARTIKVASANREQMQSNAERSPSPQVLDLSWTEREARMLPGQIAYLRPGPFYNPQGPDLWNNESFKTFIDQAFEQFIAKEAGSLLIDLRNNPGGDNSFSDLMLAWFADQRFRFYSHFNVKVSQAAIDSNQQRLDQQPDSPTSLLYAKEYATHEPGSVFAVEFPFVKPREGQRFTGSVYVLINRHSYSNTVTVAAMVQDYGFGIVLGEETADLATTLGAMEHFQLQHSGITVGFPKAQIIRPNGDTMRRGVVPDVAIATPLLESADDPVLQQALAYVRQQETVAQEE